MFVKINESDRHHFAGADTFVGWIEVVPTSSGYVIKYYAGCPC